MVLTVAKLPAEDAWKDIVRIPKAFRVDKKGRRIPRGAICCITTGTRSRWVVVHGLPTKNAVIQMDLNVRLGLGVTNGVPNNFDLARISWVRSLWFPWRASDPIYRLPAQLGFIGLLLGLIGLLVGLIPIWEEHHKARDLHKAGAPAAIRQSQYDSQSDRQ